MRIGFYAPLKAPDHPVPSGDRQMARLLMAALGQAGHDVDLLSTLRAYTADPAIRPLAALRQETDRELARLEAVWRHAGAPDLIFTYHSYYKAPDLLGPRLAATFSRPYVTAEASLSSRRVEGAWAAHQALVVEGVRAARLNVCFTDRDRIGLSDVVSPGSLASLPPFIDAAPRSPVRGWNTGPMRLVTVAMMRPGDKLRSYRFLATALASLPPGQPWRLDVIGDGPARLEVEQAFAVLPAGSVRWRGAVPSHDVAGLLDQADLFVWPGFNEAYGLCYLEAQAAGLPVVAVRNAGTPAVIQDGLTGHLTDADPDRFAAAILSLLRDRDTRARMGRAATDFVHRERNLTTAAERLAGHLQTIVESDPAR